MLIRPQLIVRPTLIRTQVRLRRTIMATPSSSSDAASALADAIKAQGELVRQLKAAPAEQRDVKAVAEGVEKLKALKTELATLEGRVPEKPSGGAGGGGAGGKSKGKGKTAEVGLQLKVPKGTKDHHPREMLVRQKIFSTITEVFKLHGAVTIDTPVFELKEILAGKYGEDSKLIYDLQDQGGELCSLRYDLTVPFARFLAMNGKEYPNIKRYHIAKVYRRDQPAMTKGRMREFYQCDFDIAGATDAMVADSEVLLITVEVLTALDIGDFSIKLNHRKLLDGIFEICGVPNDKIRTISSAVDKLDKLPWEAVKKEMTEEKGLDGEVADRIGHYVKLKGSEDLLDRLVQDEKLTANKTAKEGLEDMKLLFQYLDIFGITHRISFDLSLARGLDYYTGLIYEAVVEGSAPPGFALASAAHPAAPSAPAPAKAPSKAKAAATGEEDEVDESTVGVGSVAAGGRYDNLVGMFSAGREKIPCVGISFGVERLFSLLMAKAAGSAQGGRGKETDVYVMSVGEGLLEERMKVCKELWDAGIKAEFMYKAKPKTARQFEVVDKDRIPFIVILGPDELADGRVKVKEQVGKEKAEEAAESEKDGVTIRRGEMTAWLKERLAQRAI